MALAPPSASAYAISLAPGVSEWTWADHGIETWCTTPPHVAASAGDSEFLRRVIERGMPLEFLTSVDDNGYTPAHIAAGCGYVEFLKEMLNIAGESAHRDATAALVFGRRSLVEELLEPNGPVSGKNLLGVMSTMKLESLCDDPSQSNVAEWAYKQCCVGAETTFEMHLSDPKFTFSPAHVAVAAGR
jgi:hypothetical protein